MTTYFIFFFVLSFFSVKGLQKTNTVYQKGIEYLLVFITICFVGFRYRCDNDYNNYVVFYNAIPLLPDVAGIVNWSKQANIELGFVFINSLLHTIGLGSQSIFLFSSCVIFIVVYNILKRYTKYTAVAFFVFTTQYFMLPFTQIRFGIAAAISLYACSLLPTKQKKKYWFFILLAVLFHTVAIASVIVWFFWKINWLKKPILIFTILFVSLLFVIFPVGNIFAHLFSYFSKGRYSVYLDLFNAGKDVANQLSIISNMVLILPLIIFRETLYKKGVNVNFCFTMMLSGILIGSLVWQLSILYRFSAINTMILCVVIPSYLHLINVKDLKIFGCFLIIVYCLLKFQNHMMYLFEYRMFFEVFI